jgi:hypothetical protein
MIPAIDEDFTEEFDEEIDPSLDYAMNFDKKVVKGKCDELEAMKQVIFKILNTERYENVIYSWDYGIELKDLYGMSMIYVVPELERRIKEALEADDRIDSVDDFDFEVNRRNVTAKFTVHTIFGDLEDEEMGVEV